MRATPLDHLLRQALQDRRERGQLRSLRLVDPIDAVHVRFDGRGYINFSSNNYLGLTHHPKILQAAMDSLRHHGLGAGASALITGHASAHADAQAAIARLKNTESAVLAPSGYQANLAAVQTLSAISPAGKKVRFLLDKLCHASLVDAVATTGRTMRVFPHNHLAKLKRLLADADPDEHQVVVTESIFSMDGDAADLPGIVSLKQLRPFTLLLDEAHATGVYGPHGAGLAAELQLESHVDVSIITLSKALGAFGGAVCSSKLFCDAVNNFGRSVIYTTNPPPLMAAAAVAALRVLHEEPHRQSRLRNLAAKVRNTLKKIGLKIPAGDSPIIPIILGPENAALAAAGQFLAAGLLVVPVRPPTVPRGVSRLRITLSCEHSDADIEQLLSAAAHLSRSSKEKTP